MCADRCLRYDWYSYSLFFVVVVLHLHFGRTATFLASFSHFQADRLMFAIHLVHGMHPEMFEAKVILFTVCFYFLVVVVVLIFLRHFVFHLCFCLFAFAWRSVIVRFH